MYFAKNYLVNHLRFVLLFPNFQRSFGLVLTPSFLSECKGKNLYFNTQILFDFFESFFSQNRFKKCVKTIEELTPFCFGSAKVRTLS